MPDKVIGLTGGIASGKNIVAALFAKHGIEIIDTDIIARDLTISGGAAMQAIRNDFGSSFCLEDGAMNRVAMREEIFSNQLARKKLESILHPMILAQCKLMLTKVRSVYSLLVVPLLFETNVFLPLTTRSLVVDCDENMQISRIKSRDGFTEEQSRLIISAQCSRQERLMRADDIIYNNSDFPAVSEQVKILHSRYLKFYSDNKNP